MINNPEFLFQENIAILKYLKSKYFNDTTEQQNLAVIPWNQVLAAVSHWTLRETACLGSYAFDGEGNYFLKPTLNFHLILESVACYLLYVYKHTYKSVVSPIHWNLFKKKRDLMPKENHKTIIKAGFEIRKPWGLEI